MHLLANSSKEINWYNMFILISFHLEGAKNRSKTLNIVHICAQSVKQCFEFLNFFYKFAANYNYNSTNYYPYEKILSIDSLGWFGLAKQLCGQV
jgi:hypothetical protein